MIIYDKSNNLYQRLNASISNNIQLSNNPINNNIILQNLTFSDSQDLKFTDLKLSIVSEPTPNAKIYI
jgi:hypothetical protein